MAVLLMSPWRPVVAAMAHGCARDADEDVPGACQTCSVVALPAWSG